MSMYKDPTYAEVVKGMSDDDVARKVAQYQAEIDAKLKEKSLFYKATKVTKKVVTERRDPGYKDIDHSISARVRLTTW